MKKLTTFDELIAEANRVNLYPKLIQQLNKDLQISNVNVEFDADILPSSLKLILHETIYKLIQDNFMDYLNLLYIVDVSEEKVRQLDGNYTLQLSENVTFLILMREWQKVNYRNNLQG